MIARYLSHPQVNIDPGLDIRRWGLNPVGHQRVQRLAESNRLSGTRLVVSSSEVKAMETAEPLANVLDCPLLVREAMHENDRSATGFLPPHEFEAVADVFFSRPDQSVRGWETATDAQARIVGEVNSVLADHQSGDILFVGHGGVGTLLYCHLAEAPIDRKHDQLPGGGCYFEFTLPDRQVLAGWGPMENL